MFIPRCIFTDQSDWFIESCGKVKNKTSQCMYFPCIFYLASSDFNFLFVFNLSNISSYTNSRYIHIVSVMVSIRTSRFIYITYTFWWTIFRVYDLKMFDGMIKIEFDKFYCDQSREKIANKTLFTMCYAQHQFVKKARN